MLPVISIVIPTKNRIFQLKRLLDSILISESLEKLDYEIIVVNDDAQDISKLLCSYPIHIINNKQNKGLAFSRNQGALKSGGKYILFIDDDNIVDRKMLIGLYQVLERYKRLIAVGPLTLYHCNPKQIWFLGGRINLFTSGAIFYNGILSKSVINENLLSTENLHNCFMARKELGDKVGWFDEKIFMGGTEFDCFMKIKKIYPKHFLATHRNAKCYHDIAPKNKNYLRDLGLENAKRIFYFQRNRGVIIRRYGNIINIFALAFIFYPLYFFMYSALSLSKCKLNLFFWNLMGVLAGYHYLLFKKF